MKIRTDFVTNSSSSSFSVALTITDKVGNAYSLDFDPYMFSEDGGECYFSGSLERLSIKGMLDNIRSSLAAEYELKEPSKENRAVRNACIEDLKAGDPLDLVMLEQGIDVRSGSVSLGFLPAKAALILFEYANEPNILITPVVGSVTPLSKRSRSAKIALVSVSFRIEAPDNKLFVLDSVSDLCRMLVGMIHVNAWLDEDDWDEEEDWDEDEGYEDFEDDYGMSAADAEASKQSFVDKVSRGIKSVGDIASIEVKREYNAWGECADLVADNDAELCRLAKKVLSAKGEAQTTALTEMESYIDTSKPERFCESFGNGYEDFRYAWNGDHAALLSLAQRLCSGYGPGDVEGEEVERLDLTTGKCERYAAFTLK